MRITLDKSVNAAYIYLTDSIKPGDAIKTYALADFVQLKDMVNLDFDAKGKLLGIEVLSANSQLPKELLDQAEIIG